MHNNKNNIEACGSYSQHTQASPLYTVYTGMHKKQRPTPVSCHAWVVIRDQSTQQ